MTRTYVERIHICYTISFECGKFRGIPKNTCFLLTINLRENISSSFFFWMHISTRSSYSCDFRSAPKRYFSVLIIYHGSSSVCSDVSDYFWYLSVCVGVFRYFSPICIQAPFSFAYILSAYEIVAKKN